MELFLKAYDGDEYESASIKGKKCITQEERLQEHNVNSFGFNTISLPVWEKLSKQLNLDTAKGFLDQGCGTGQILLYSFLMFPNLKNVYGIELSKIRFEMCRNYFSKLNYKTQKNTDREFVISDGDRNLYLTNCSMYEYEYDI